MSGDANEAPRPLGTACVILAAGAGTRFGMPKAEAELRPGVRFLDAVAAAARQAGCAPLVAVVPPGVGVPEGVIAVAGVPGSEMQRSLQLGLARLANAPVDAMLLWPVDHVMASARSAGAVIAAARARRAPIAVPVHAGRRGHPAWFHRDVWRELVTVREGGARTVVHGYGARVLEVPVEDQGVVRDVDTRDDLADLLADEEARA